MPWVKKGRIYSPAGEQDWQQHTFITPTPFLLNEKTIRLYGGFRDAVGASRIGYIDLNASNPSEIISVSKNPVIDLGVPGCFDDNGMILGDVIPDGDTIRMYYVGFQIVDKVKFLAFSSCAVSYDGGETFTRLSQTPLLDRSDEGLYIRAIHSVLYEDGVWKIWYSVGSGWELINTISYPQYHIHYCESKDGITLPLKGKHLIECGENEYRIGRPRVYRTAIGYEMFFTSDTYDKNYSVGHATSLDGVNWNRDDSLVGILPSAEGWDSQMLCYPALLEASGQKYMFYSGNNMGQTGVGYAVWEGA